MSAALVAAATVPIVTVPASGAGGSATRTASAVSNGYWMYAADGGIFSFGSAGYHGPVGNQGRDIAGMAVTPSGNGYWMADDDGDVFAAGDARIFGQRASGLDDVAAFAARPQGDGYWMATRTGTVEHYGAAPAFPGASVKLSHRITTLAPTAGGSGAWMAGIDGGVFTFGDATFFGSMGGRRLNQPIVGMAPTPSGRGYWLVASDGGIFSFGDARFFGSMGGTPLVAPVVGMAPTATGAGYWMVAADGGIFAFGDARFHGSMGGTPLVAPVRGMLARPGSPDPVVEPAHTAPPGPPGTPAPPGTTPTTAPPPGPGPDTRVATLVGAGDIASCGSGGPSASKAEATAKVLDTIPRDPSTVVWTAGDNVYNSGSPTEFATCYGPTWGRHKDRTRPAPGNHEYGTANASGYFNYFGPVAGQPGKGWYSYDIGAWHVVVLNSHCGSVGGCGAGSAQEQWLRADLAASQARCTVAIWHHPRFNSGNSHGNNTAVGPLWTALYQYGAELILNGHEHVYERFAPQRPDQVADSTFGIRQFTVGTGGAGAYAFAGTAQPNSQRRSTGANGVLKMTLRAGGYDWQFLPIAGHTFADTGSGTCHDRP
ncbi:MAG TPA: metallophosphoesterase [Acidimicrobiia bacterium]|nr:metallophosphoesterase [Acidimicrobiia bacterium]